MNLRRRISSFAQLGSLLPGLINDRYLDQIYADNHWFTKSECRRALKAWSALLTLDNLEKWTRNYPIHDVPPRNNILVITAGNIPLVGFHDFLCVLMSGNRFIGKLASRDNQFIRILANELIRIAPEFADLIRFDEHSIIPRGIIATGSDNSSRYFKAEYGHIHHIIRKNRTSAAILTDSETPDDLDNLASDILEYYGLGCRNISHLFLPTGYSPGNLTLPLSTFRDVDPCELYTDNLRYQRARYALSGVPVIDAGKVLLVESDNLHSPIGVVHFSFYSDVDVLFRQLENHILDIQCLSGNLTQYQQVVPLGTAQRPDLWDYADNIDTMDFLMTVP